jgi:outer membrane protein assembly factor BamB
MRLRIAGVLLAAAVSQPGSLLAVADAAITVSLGPVEISTYNPVTITGLETDTSLYFDLRNTGLAPVTLRLPDPKQVQRPNFSEHLFAFQANEITLSPGERQVAEYMLSREGQGTATLDFPFEIVGTGQRSIRIEVSSVETPRWRDLITTATVTGAVTSGGQPLAGVDVTIVPYNGRERFTERTDAAGRYSARIPSIDEIVDAMGPRPLPYRSRDYFIVVDTPGYSLGYADGIGPSRGAIVEKDLSVSPIDAPSYELVKEIATNGPHGYFWVEANEAFTRFAAVQARHPPELNRPGHIIMFDNNGTVLWQRETLDECWGFHFVNNRVAAGCNDRSAYLLDSDGNLRWQQQAGDLNREVELNSDATRLFTGPLFFGGQLGTRDVALIDTGTGQPLWTFTGTREHLRNSRFTASSQRIVAGFGWGALSMLDSAGRELWRRYIGEFPMFLEVDSGDNVYAAGKNRTVFSYDAAGNLRWRYRIPNGTALAGLSNMNAAGDLIVFGSQRGVFYALDADGRVRWQRPAPRGSWQGHNAIAVTRNGHWIVAGTSDNTVWLFDSNGSLLWKNTATDRRAPGSYGDNNAGVIAVTVSEDARTIVAGYSDSTIRIFRRN